jgi:predicted kinase
MKKFLILLDGPKGSGKSTLSGLLKEHLTETEFFSLDNERKLLERTDSIDNDNKRAFHVITEKLEDTFKQNKNAVIDSGISEERLKILETLANTYDIQIHKFSLIAPYDVLHSRVKERDKSRGKDFDENRFNLTFKGQQSKSFEDYSIIDSSKLSPQEMFEMVRSKIS